MIDLRRRFRAGSQRLFVPTFFLILAIWSTWPLVRHLRTAIPVGTEKVATVPIFNLWTIWWNADRLKAGYQDYWQAPIFHPTPNTFAFSESQLTTGLVAPLVWGDSAETAYNTFLLLSLALNGWSAWRLLRRVGFSPVTALCGGALVEMLPMVHWQLGVLQLVPLFGIVWTIHAMYDWGETPSLWRATRIGLAFGVTYLTCNYHGLYLGLLLVLACPWLVARSCLKRSAWIGLLAGAVVGGLTILPIVGKQLTLSKQHDWKRSDRLVLKLSARIGDYTRTPWPQWVALSDPSKSDRPGWTLCPGTIKLALAGLGILGGVWSRRWRTWTLFWLTLAALAVLISLGLNLQIGGWQPYRLLMNLPGFSAARNVFRFAFFAQLGVVFLAATGIQVALTLVESRWSAARLSLPAPESHPDQRETVTISPPAGLRWQWWLVTMFAGIIGGLALLEVQPARQRTFRPPSLEEHDGWTSWLRRNTPPDAVLACIPFPQGPGVAKYEGAVEWMFLGTLHRRRIVNGYSGFFPQPFLQVKQSFQGFPRPASRDAENLAALDSLADVGVTYCVISRSISDAMARESECLERLKLEHRDPVARVDVYRLMPARVVQDL